MFGDLCPHCNSSTPSSCGCPSHEEEASPCLPGPGNGECETWVPLSCAFWTGDPIPGTPIKKGTKGTEIITYLLAQIAELKQQLADMEVA